MRNESDYRKGTRCRTGTNNHRETACRQHNGRYGRGYSDYSLFAWLSKRGTTFVTRLKDNAVTTPLKKGCRSEGDNYGDYQFEFDSPAGREACGELQFRVVQWHDTDNDRWFNFLTNDMDLKPEQIAALYKER